ncbi:GtrA family protein [Butyrivibrio sp. CB08]|nr:GtrA family protein [Butyrivibrio sp. CB08]
MKWLEKHKLLYQIFKFGVVGFVCFFIDYIVGLVAMNIIVAIFGKESFEVASVIGSVCGFIVSVVANYILSFKFVFERKEDLNRKAEFVAFVILSIIGMGINSAIIWLGVSYFYKNIAWLHANVGNSLMYTIAKIVATAVVMVYNFVTRKIFLEKKD